MRNRISELKALQELDSRHVLNMRVDATSYLDASTRIISWAKGGINAYVCAANVHMTMTSWDDRKFSSIVNDAAIVAPDGMPLVWALQLLGLSDASRVYGPTLTLHVCELAEKENISIALYGGSETSLNKFSDFLQKKFPHINISCQISPPFRPLSQDENDRYINQIKESGAQILLVGIGCPKQEIWMAKNKNSFPGVMLGIGAAFDFYSGMVRQAPSWMQNLGIEWLFRLLMEPKRLWKRYLYNNPRFLFLFFKQLFVKNALR